MESERVVPFLGTASFAFNINIQVPGSDASATDVAASNTLMDYDKLNTNHMIDAAASAMLSEYGKRQLSDY